MTDDGQVAEQELLRFTEQLFEAVYDGAGRVERVTFSPEAYRLCQQANFRFKYAGLPYDPVHLPHIDTFCGVPVGVGDTPATGVKVE